MNGKACDSLATPFYSDEIHIEYTSQRKYMCVYVYTKQDVRLYIYTHTDPLPGGGQWVFLWDAQQAEEEFKVQGEVGSLRSATCIHKPSILNSIQWAQ